MSTIKILELFGGIGSPRIALKQAGNSIPVPIFESIFKKIILGQTNKTNRQRTIFDDKEN